jgi:3-(3-hydroxy-phenyl)propionate hydroxylase
MNGGIHDAINLTDRLAAVWHGSKGDAELDRFDKQRRLVTKEYVEKHRSRTRRTWSPRHRVSRPACRDRGDPGQTRDYLLAVSMISSLRRAQELG